MDSVVVVVVMIMVRYWQAADLWIPWWARHRTAANTRQSGHISRSLPTQPTSSPPAADAAAHRLQYRYMHTRNSWGPFGPFHF